MGGSRRRGIRWGWVGSISKVERRAGLGGWGWDWSWDWDRNVGLSGVGLVGREFRFGRGYMGRVWKAFALSHSYELWGVGSVKYEKCLRHGRGNFRGGERLWAPDHHCPIDGEVLNIILVAFDGGLQDAIEHPDPCLF